MSVVSTQPDRFGFSVLEYVWDYVWGGPAMVIGFQDDPPRLTVAEIVQPDQSWGRVAHRLTKDVCRYVKVLFPEDEAETVEGALGASVGMLVSDETLELMREESKTDRQVRYEVEEIVGEQEYRGDLIKSARTRIHDARVRRGLVVDGR